MLLAKSGTEEGAIVTAYVTSCDVTGTPYVMPYDVINTTYVMSSTPLLRDVIHLKRLAQKYPNMT